MAVDGPAQAASVPGSGPAAAAARRFASDSEEDDVDAEADAIARIAGFSSGEAEEDEADDEELYFPEEKGVPIQAAGAARSTGPPQVARGHQLALVEAHEAGTCKRCCFFPKATCTKGDDCEYCHLDHTRRRRVKKKKGKRLSADDLEDEFGSEEADGEDEGECGEEEGGFADAIQSAVASFLCDPDELQAGSSDAAPHYFVN